MSEVTVRIPAPLRAFADGRAELGAPAGTVADVLQAACEHYPGLGQRLFTPEGELRPFVNVFVGERHIAGLQGLDTQVESGDVLSIIPAVAGGC